MQTHDGPAMNYTQSALDNHATLSSIRVNYKVFMSLIILLSTLVKTAHTLSSKNKHKHTVKVTDTNNHHNHA